MTLESIEKLRLMVSQASFKYDVHRKEMLDGIDEIKREIAERYMELPVDADGEPIHVGDEMLNGRAEPMKVIAVSDLYGGQFFSRTNRRSPLFTSSCYRHYRKPTVESVLREFAENIDAYDANYIDAYAERVREAVRGE